MVRDLLSCKKGALVKQGDFRPEVKVGWGVWNCGRASGARESGTPGAASWGQILSGRLH